MKLGILGGMGPLATADFFKKIVLMTDACSDQEHIRVLMDNNPQIPDRTAFIMGNGIDPTEAMVRSALKLEYMGADFIAMPCNTAHYFHKTIQSYLKVPLLNMIDLTAEFIKENWPSKKKAVLLATKGTYKAGLYKFALEAQGIEMVEPSEKMKTKLMDWIYTLKSTGKVPTEKDVKTLLDLVTENEAHPVILGCTELPVIIDRYGLKGIFIDTTTVLAKSCVDMGQSDVNQRQEEPITA